MLDWICFTAIPLIVGFLVYKDGDQSLHIGNARLDLFYGYSSDCGNSKLSFFRRPVVIFYSSCLHSLGRVLRPYVSLVVKTVTD
jgi:hypothetical protein